MSLSIKSMYSNTTLKILSAAFLSFSLNIQAQTADTPATVNTSMPITQQKVDYVMGVDKMFVLGQAGNKVVADFSVTPDDSDDYHFSVGKLFKDPINTVWHLFATPPNTKNYLISLTSNQDTGVSSPLNALMTKYAQDKRVSLKVKAFEVSGQNLVPVPLRSAQLDNSFFHLRDAKSDPNADVFVLQQNTWGNVAYMQLDVNKNGHYQIEVEAVNDLPELKNYSFNLKVRRESGGK